MTNEKYYSFQEILKFLGFDYEFEHKNNYPFTKNKEDVIFSWGQILIPKYGIRETVKNKLADVKEMPINELHMIYQVPYVIIDDKNKGVHTGIVNKDIELTFRYDKEYKYGDINKSIYETCFAIIEYAKETNNFFIIDDGIQEFFSYYIINNQWGLGSILSTHNPMEKFGEKEETDLTVEEICNAEI